MQVVAETERLLLRQLNLGDAAFILQLVNDPDWLIHIGERNVHTIADAKSFIIAGPKASYRQHGFGLFVMARRTDNSLLGLCGLLQREYLPCPDIGYAILPEYRCCGYTLEACRGILSYAKRQLGLETVAGIVSPGNIASIALLKKLGMQWLEDREHDGMLSSVFKLSLLSATELA